MEEESPPPSQKPASELLQEQPRPKVTPRVLQQAKPETLRIVISISNQRAWLFAGEEVAIDTPVSTGKRAGMTPLGEFQVLERALEFHSPTHGSFVDKNGRVVRSGVSTKIDSAPSGTAFRAEPMKYFLRITPNGLGLHAGSLPGYPASHGNIRLPEDIARILYEHSMVGTKVSIVE